MNTYTMLNWNSQERLRSWETNERKEKRTEEEDTDERKIPRLVLNLNSLSRNLLNHARARGQAGRQGEKKERKEERKNNESKHLGAFKPAIVNSSWTRCRKKKTFKIRYS
jgi:hypothetical protein